MYWLIKVGDVFSLLGLNFSFVVLDEGYYGYYFCIISDNDGYGVVFLVWLMYYGEIGVMSFMVNQDDCIY